MMMMMMMMTMMMMMMMNDEDDEDDDDDGLMLYDVTALHPHLALSGKEPMKSPAQRPCLEPRGLCREPQCVHSLSVISNALGAYPCS
eukprot:11148305-Karenia_brevis.AAC.1